MSDTHIRRGLGRVPLADDVYTLARQRTAYIMDNHDKVLVMFSGGKDSTAVLNVALDVAHSDPRFARHLPLRVVFYDEEAIPLETEEYVRRTFQRDDIAGEWYCLPLKHRNACSRLHPYWWPWAPEDRDKWCRPLPPEALTELPGFPLHPPEARMTAPEANGLFAPPPHTTAVLMGIRAQESITRLRAVTKRKIDNYIVKYGGKTDRGNLWKAYPVYDWKTEDIWAAPKKFGWDYNHAYDLLEMAGVGAGLQRCSPAFGEEPLQKIHTYAQCFPEVWAKMSERVPGVGAAYRYALTELYAYRDRPEKPPGMAWPDWCAHYLKKFRPGDAAMVADRIKSDIETHYRKTTHPIALKAPHPITGMCWYFIFTVAMRGDFKKRKQQGSKLNKPPEKLWADYADDLAASLQAGTYGELAYPRAFPANPYDLIPARFRTTQE